MLLSPTKLTAVPAVHFGIVAVQGRNHSRLFQDLLDVSIDIGSFSPKENIKATGFGAGMLATWSLGKRISEFFEKNIVLLFPRYAILKDQMADTIGGDHAKPSMKPVLIKFNELSRIGFETERCEAEGLVAVYLPGSPDPWAGKVALVDMDRVEPLSAEFGVAAATCEQLGRGSARLITESRSKPTQNFRQ